MLDHEWRLIATIAMAVLATAAQVLFRRVRRRLKELIRREHPFGLLLHGGVDWGFVLLSLAIWIAVASGVLAAIPQTRFLTAQMLELLSQGFSLLGGFFDTPIVPGKTRFSVKDLFKVMAAITVIALLARGARRLLLNYILSKTPMDLSVRHAVATFSQYLIVTVGFLLLLQSAAEVDLTMLGVVAAAVGVGVGFGLQNIANNFISGIFIFFERPIKVGDRIEVGEVHGHVVRIGGPRDHGAHQRQHRHHYPQLQLYFLQRDQLEPRGPEGALSGAGCSGLRLRRASGRAAPVGGCPRKRKCPEGTLTAGGFLGLWRQRPGVPAQGLDDPNASSPRCLLRPAQPRHLRKVSAARDPDSLPPTGPAPQDRAFRLAVALPGLSSFSPWAPRPQPGGWSIPRRVSRTVYCFWRSLCRICPNRRVSSPY